MIEKPSAEVIAGIEDGTVVVTRRLSIFEKDGETPWVPEGPSENPIPRLLQGGKISIDYGREERRTIDISLDNFDFTLRPRPGGFWYDKVIKVWRGLDIGTGGVSDIREWQLGEFMIDNLQQANFPGHVKVVGRDQTKKMLQSKLANSASWEANTKVHTLVRALAANSNVSKLDRLPGESPELGKKLDAERGIARWQIAKDACRAKGYDLYFDSEGYLRMELFADPALGAIEWTFKTGSEGNLVNYERSVDDSLLYNIVIVQSEAPEGGGIPFFYKAENRQPNSPTNIDEIGERMAPVITLASASSERDCRIAANKELKIAGLESYNINFGSILYPWLDAGIVTQILEPDRFDTDPVRFLLSTIDMSLDLEPMSGTARRVTIVGTIETPDEEEPPIEPPPDVEEPDEEEPEEPDNPTEPPDNPNGPPVDLTLGTWNVRDGQPPGPVAEGLDKMVDAGADIICVQEGNDCTAAFKLFLRRHDAWAMWRGGSNWLIQEQAVAIFYKKKLGKVTGKKYYFAGPAKFLGPRGKPKRTGKKFTNRVEIKLDNGRTINILNNHMIASAGRSRAWLGNNEYENRIGHYQQCIGNLRDVIDNLNSLVLGCGDFNLQWGDNLLNPLSNVAEIDHNFNTHTSGTRIDFVYHIPHAAISVRNTKKMDSGPSDHNPILVTYRIRGA